MKLNLLVLAFVTFGLFLFSAQSWAVCPQSPNDNGECDTFYLEILPADQVIDPWHTNPPYFVRFPMYVTHDVLDPTIDSICAMDIPLCFNCNNLPKYCSLSYYWNNATNFTNPRSIFRHLEVGEDTIHNWMMDQFEEGNHEEWNGIFLNLDGISRCWFSLVPTGSEDQRFGPGSRVLLATMTFKQEDTMTICVDTCIWPPGGYDIVFARSDAVTYRPRHFFPVCETAGPLPPEISCPPDESPNANGSFQTSPFSAWSDLGEITSVTPHFYGWGVTDVNLVYLKPPPQTYVDGYITYTVTDHCQ